MSRNSWVFVIILVILAFSLWVLIPIDADRFGRKGIQYGLDLEGGVGLQYQVDLTTVEEDKAKEVINDLMAVISNRVNPLGVTEPNIERLGDDQIVVEIPMPEGGLSDAQKERIGRMVLLEFRELVQTVDDEGNLVETWVPAKATINGEEKVFTSAYFKDNTFVDYDPINKAIIHFENTEEGAQIFQQITSRLAPKAGEAHGQPLAIFEGSGEDAVPLKDAAGEMYRPTVDGVISDEGVIEGLDLEDAQDLSKQLNAGRLPVPLVLIGEKTVDPSLGSDFIKSSVTAGLIGIAAVMVFLIAYYRVPGVIASLALAFYGTLTLAIFKLIPVTMTLAGIGGFVLSMGMAIDANVLIFERMKEELLIKTTVSSAMEAGFSRAWTAIWDSNVTTIIACLVLYWVGDVVGLGGNAVKGFALTLGIGVLVSMFTAVLASHTLLRMVVYAGFAKKTELFKPYTGRRLA